MTDGQPLGERVAKLEAILPEIRDELREMRVLIGERLDEHEDRITTLERWRSWVLGAAAAVGAAADAFWRWLSAGRQGG
ncbi:MAG TPA: hypothetical protein VIK99_08535 [Thermaerobacter sp.]